MRAPAPLAGDQAAANIRKFQQSDSSRPAPVSQHPDLARGSDRDARWFARERYRSHRLRRPVGLEAELLGYDPAKYPGEPIIVTRQFAPGVARMRIAMSWLGTLPPNLEPVADALFNAASDPGRETITADELRNLARELAPRGWA